MEKKEKSNMLKESIGSILPSAKGLKNSIRFLALLTALGSVVALVCSSYLTDRYSDFYGVHASNLNILSTARELIVAFGPLLIILLIARFIISFMFSALFEQDKPRVLFGASATLFLLLVFSTFLSSWLLGNVTAEFMSNYVPILLIYMCVVCLGAILICFVPLKCARFREFVVVTVVLTTVTFCGAFFFYSIMKFKNMCDPRNIRSYELVSIDNNDYVIVYSSEESKIAMKCTQITESNALKIHYGNYRFIRSEDYEFEYRTFDSVWRDIDK